MRTVNLAHGIIVRVYWDKCWEIALLIIARHVIAGKQEHHVQEWSCPCGLAPAASQWSPHGLCHPSTGPWSVRPDTTYYCCRFFLLSSALRLLAPNGNCLLHWSAKRIPSSQCLCLFEVLSQWNLGMFHQSSLLIAILLQSSIQKVNGYLADTEPAHMSCPEDLCCSLQSCNMVKLNSF